jgi:hypothetical protein
MITIDDRVSNTRLAVSEECLLDVTGDTRGGGGAIEIVETTYDGPAEDG